MTNAQVSALIFDICQRNDVETVQQNTPYSGTLEQVKCARWGGEPITMTFWDILSLGQLSFDHLGNRPGPFAPLPQSSPALRPRILWKGLHVLPLPRSSATLPDPSDKSYGFCIIKRLSWFQRLRGLRFREPRWRPSRRPSPPLAIGINLLYVCLLADNTCVSSYELKIKILNAE